MTRWDPGEEGEKCPTRSSLFSAGRREEFSGLGSFPLRYFRACLCEGREAKSWEFVGRPLALFLPFFCLFGWTSPFYTTLPALGEKHHRYIAFGGKEMAAVVQ